MPIALSYDLSLFDFWNMTLKEINMFLKAIKEKTNRIRQEQYLQASLNANFVGFIINGKQIPPIHEIFPEYYEEETAQKIREEQEYNQMMLYKEQMIDYMNAVNKRNRQRNGDKN